MLGRIWRFIRRSLNLIWMLIPYLWKAVKACLEAMLLAGSTIVKDIPRICNNLAVEQARAVMVERSIPNEFEPVLRRLFLCLAYCFMVFGWILLAYATVTILVFTSVVF